MIKEAIKKLSAKKDLYAQEMTEVFDEIMSGIAEKEDVKKFLLSLKVKGESPEEIAAAAGVMREKMKKVYTSAENLVDTCGTGGAPINDINISTISAIVLSGCGVKIAKHGNRSFTGKCGSADILAELGVKIELRPQKVRELIEKVGIGFIFAPNFHPAMKNVMEARKELKTRTIFNILGPLSNPAGANMQLIGVYSPGLTEIMAEALNKLGSKKAYVVHGLEGLDEISINGETKISELKDGEVRTRTIRVEDFGVNEGSLDDIRGGSPEYNKKVTLEILEGKDMSSRRDMVLINAAAVLKMIEKAQNLKEGVKLAAECIDSGKALEKLNRLRDESNK
jgi:anthranilate phosphoribosyltransferase